MRRLALALLLLFAVRCERETPAPPPAPTPIPQQQIRDGGRLQRRIESDVQTLNYILHSGEEERQVLAYLYEPLLAFDANLQPIPCLATKWEISADRRTYTLHLDPRATFSDATPVRARDVVFTILKSADESPQFGAWFDGLDRAGTRALDDHTVQVAFKEARATQLLSFNISVVPEHVYGKGELSKVAAIVGNGPYKFVRRETGRTILLERRKDYWREKPHIESILFRVVSDNTTAWNGFLRGTLDVGRIDNDVWFREKDNPAVKAKIEFFNAWLLSYNCFTWNVDDPLFNDARVRQAMAMSFDRNTVIEKLYYGQARPVTGPFTPDQWANNPAVEPIVFNPVAASALLKSAGWQDTNGDGVLDRGGKPFAFTMLIPEGKVGRDHSQILQDALQKIGVKMELQTMEGASFFDRLLKRDFQAAFLSWVLEPDPDRDLFSLFHSSQKAPEGMNIGGYASAEVDELIAQGRVEVDPVRRTDIYHQLHDVIARDQPYLWTVQVGSKWAVNRRVQNVRVGKGLGLFLWYPGPMAWWLKA